MAKIKSRMASVGSVGTVGARFLWTLKRVTPETAMTQHIWDAAGACVRRLRLPELLDADFDTREEMDRLTLEIVGEDGLTIAHAILAERERCMQVVKDYQDFRKADVGNIGAACSSILVAMGIDEE